jgi:hypothetical protein
LGVTSTGIRSRLVRDRLGDVAQGLQNLVDEVGSTRGIHSIVTAEDLMVNLTGLRAVSEPSEFIIFPALSRRIA